MSARIRTIVIAACRCGAGAGHFVHAAVSPRAAGLEIAVDLSLRWPFFSLRTTKPLMGQPCQLLIY